MMMLLKYNLCESVKPADCFALSAMSLEPAPQSHPLSCALMRHYNNVLHITFRRSDKELIFQNGDVPKKRVDAEIA